MRFRQPSVPKTGQFKFPLREAFFPLRIWPGLPITNKIYERYCLFITINKCFQQHCSQNKAKRQNYKLAAFKVNLNQHSKR